MDSQGVPGRREDPNALPDDLFEPDRNAPLPKKTDEETPPADTTPDEPGLTPPDPNAPDMPSDPAPTDTVPEVKPPAAAPGLPDDLFDEKKPAGTPPGHGSLGTDPLPIDAPEGDLVTDGSDSNRKKVAAEKKPNVTPTGPRLGPAEPPIQSARRQSAIRRTSAIESLPPAKRDVFADDDSDGPELQAPATTRSSAAPPKGAVSPQSGTIKGSSKRKAAAAPIQWTGDDGVQLVAPRLTDSRVEKGTWQADRSAQRANSSRRTVATDSRTNDASR